MLWHSSRCLQSCAGQCLSAAWKNLSGKKSNHGPSAAFGRNQMTKRMDHGNDGKPSAAFGRNQPTKQKKRSRYVTDALTHARNEGNSATETHGLNTDDLLRCAPARLTLSVFNPCFSVAKNSLS